MDKREKQRVWEIKVNGKNKKNKKHEEKCRMICYEYIIHTKCKGQKDHMVYYIEEYNTILSGSPLQWHNVLYWQEQLFFVIGSPAQWQSVPYW